MEVKKHPKADLEKEKLTFSLLGFVITLALVYGAFEWTSSTGSVDQIARVDDVVMEDEIIPVTRQDQTPPPPPPPPAAPAEVLEIVDDDEEIEDEMVVEDMEVKEEEEVEIIEIEEEVEQQEEEIFMIVEDMPEFPGGTVALMKYIAKNVKYPNVARENGIQGRVYIQFVVTAKGTIGEVKVGRGVDPMLDKEAVRVVKSLPKWKPGKQRGKTVPVWYTVPINFQLQ